MILQCNAILCITAAVLESNSTKIRANKNYTIRQSTKALGYHIKKTDLQKNECYRILLCTCDDDSILLLI